MKVIDLFWVYSGNKLDFGKQQQYDSGTNFISRNSNNNGIVGKVLIDDSNKTYKAGDITVPLGGSYLLSCFVQDEDFVTAQNVAVLRARNESMTDLEKWFYCYALGINRFKFSAFGREVNKYLKNIELPDNIPDWVYNVSILPIKTKIKHTILPSFDLNKWGEFELGTGDNPLFIISGTKTTKLSELEGYGEGKYPYVTTQAVNNGIAGYYDYYTENGNVLTIDSAVLGFCTYQELPFSASDHVEKLTPNFKMNKYIALFLVTLLNKEQYRYSYGRKCNQGKIKKTTINLPKTPQGTPDWYYMEQYIKSLPYGDKI